MARATDYVVLLASILAVIAALVSAANANNAYNFAGGANNSSGAQGAAIQAQTYAILAAVFAAIALLAKGVGLAAGRRRPTAEPHSEPSPPIPVSPTNSGAFCSHCGAPVVAGSSYCRACGTKIQ